MKRFRAVIVLAVLSILMIGAGYAVGQDRLISHGKMGNDFEISTICSDHKVFLIVKSTEEISGIKEGGIGVGLGVTQVLEEKEGVLLPKTCE